MANLQAPVVKEPPEPRACGSTAAGLSPRRGSRWEACGRSGSQAQRARSRSENTCRTQKVISWLCEAAGEAADGAQLRPSRRQPRCLLGR